MTDLARRSGAEEISSLLYATGRLRLVEATCSALAESWTSWCSLVGEDDLGGDDGEKIHMDGNVEISSLHEVDEADTEADSLEERPRRRSRRSRAVARLVPSKVLEEDPDAGSSITMLSSI